MTKKQLTKMLAHKFSALAYESHNIGVLAAHVVVKQNAQRLNVPAYKLAQDIHLYRNGFQYQKDKLGINNG